MTDDEKWKLRQALWDTKPDSMMPVGSMNHGRHAQWCEMIFAFDEAAGIGETNIQAHDTAKPPYDRNVIPEWATSKSGPMLEKMP